MSPSAEPQARQTELAQSERPSRERMSEARNCYSVLRMPRKCLFCPNPADSVEHVWSDWILQDLKPAKPIRIRFGKTFDKWVDNPELRMKCVCQECNSGWMSTIESENKPHMLSLMNDNPTLLPPTQQKLLTRWAILKSMILDGSSPQRRPVPFYTECERTGMKPPLRALPINTFTWIGRLEVKAFHAGLTNTFGAINGIPQAFQGCVVTIIVGHLVIQVLTMHFMAMFATSRLRPEDKPEEWDVDLSEIWPVFGEKCWPPKVSFVLNGTTPHHIGHLINRWKIGEDITK